MGRYVGIDPGAKGAICLLDTNNQSILFKPTGAVDFPPLEIHNWLMGLHIRSYFRIIGIENVSSVPGASAGSNFKFGFNVGLIRGIAESTGIGVDLVRPKAWQKAVGIPAFKAKTATAIKKKTIAEVALRLYPTADLFGPRGGLLDGRSDALMIAHFMYLKYEGNQL
jgi:hypothetical protein